MAATSFDDLLTAASAVKRDHRDVVVALDAAVRDQVDALDDRIEALESERVDVSERADLRLEELKGDARLGDPRPGEVERERDADLERIDEQVRTLEAERDALTEGTVITLRFEQLSGQQWAEIAARNPARVDVLIDRRYGYNYHETAKTAATVSGSRVLDDGTTERITPEQWSRLFPLLAGREFEAIASALWDLNDFGPTQRVAAAGKASRAGSESNSN